MSFSSNLLFATVHHALEDHHHKDEKCIAAELGEKHFHKLELEDCDLCDLQSQSNYTKVKSEAFVFIIKINTPYYISYIENFCSKEILSFSNKGPPSA